MKKRIISSILTAAMLALVLTGCGAGKTKSDVTEISVVSNERASMEVMQELINEYNETNEKNIHINFECKDDSYNDYIRTTYTSKMPPDVHISIDNTSLAEEAGWFREIPEELLNEYKDEFVEDSIQYKSHDGKIYSIGLTAGGAQKLIYNKDLFKEAGLDPQNPPKTFDEMREAAKAITAIGNGIKYGFAMPLKDGIFSRYYVMIPGAPSGYMNRDGFEPTTLTYDFSIFKPMIEFMRSLISDGSVFPTPYTLDNDTARAQFAEGNVGMIFGAPWDVAVYNDQFVAKCDYGIVDYPVFDELKGGYPYGASEKNHWFMSSMSEHPDEQLEVFKFLNSEKVAQKLLEGGFIVASTRKSLQDSIPTDAKKGTGEFAKRTYPMFITDAPNEPNLKISGDDRYTVIRNLVTDANMDIDKTLGELTKQYNDALSEYAKELEAKGETIEKYLDKDWKFVIEK